MPYFPSGENLWNMSSLIDYINNVTTFQPSIGQPVMMFGPSILLMIFSISFISLKLYHAEKAFVVSTFLTMFSSFFLSIMGLVDGSIVLTTVAIALGSVLILYKFDTSR